jgi:hypothetical protein
MYHCSKCNTDKPKDNFGESQTTRCKSCANEYARQYRAANKDVIKAKNKDWYDRAGKFIKHDYDKEHREQSRQYERDRYQNDVQYRLKKILRTRLFKTIKGLKSSKSMLSLIGFDITAFREWIEFQLGGTLFTWDNYGTTWDIDHVVPCSSFDLTDHTAKQTCFKWSNMRPLGKAQNYTKSNKILESDIATHEQVVKYYMNLDPSTK